MAKRCSMLRGRIPQTGFPSRRIVTRPSRACKKPPGISKRSLCLETYRQIPQLRKRHCLVLQNFHGPIFQIRAISGISHDWPPFAGR